MYLDSRELTEKREDLKATILADHNAEFPRNEKDGFDDIDMDNDYVASWADGWVDEIVEITDIEKLEDEVSSSEWDYGITFIPEYEFEDYCEEMVSDIGDLPSTLPNYIKNNIDWEGVADDLIVDYSEVEYQGVTYLFRN